MAQEKTTIKGPKTHIYSSLSGETAGKCYNERLGAVTFSKKEQDKVAAERTIFKHLIVKRVIAEDKDILNKFIESGIIEGFISFLFHAINKDAPKVKFIKVPESGAAQFEYGSRLYPFDSVEDFSMTRMDKKYNLNYTLSRASDDFRLPGILRAIIKQIIIENWDSKLANYVCYGKEVFPIDFEYALGASRKYSKSWSELEIESIIFGTRTASGITSVAEALAETIGELGTRTNNYYLDTNIRKGFCFSKEKKIIIKNLKEQLEAINPNNDSLALMQAFREELQAIKKHWQVAFEKSKTDTLEKIDGKISKEKIEDIYAKHRVAFLDRVKKFEVYIGNIGKKYTSGEISIPATECKDYAELERLRQARKVTPPPQPALAVQPKVWTRRQATTSPSHVGNTNSTPPYDNLLSLKGKYGVKTKENPQQVRVIPVTTVGATRVFGGFK